jgi:hypothetical protein
MKCPQVPARESARDEVLRRVCDPAGPDAVSASKTMRHGVAQPLFLMYLGEAYFLADRVEDALALAERARSLAREGGQRTTATTMYREVGMTYWLEQAEVQMGETA